MDLGERGGGRGGCMHSGGEEEKERETETDRFLNVPPLKRQVLQGIFFYLFIVNLDYSFHLFIYL